MDTVTRFQKLDETVSISCCVNIPGKGMKQTTLPIGSYRKILRQTGHLDLGVVTDHGEGKLRI